MAQPGQDGTRRRRGLFYGWWIVIASALGMSVASGVIFHGFGNFVIPLANEFGWNRTTISSVIAVGRLQSGLLGPLEGWAIDRYGPRRMMLIGVPLLGLGFVAMSRIDSLFAFYAVYLLMIAAGSGLGLGTPMIAALANWFRRRRGLAFGIAWSGVGLGAPLVLLIGWMIARFEWRDTAALIGIGILAVGFPIAMVMRHRPEQYGYLPDGDALPPGRTGERSREADLSQDFSAREALRTSSFWFLTLSVTVRMLSSGALSLHLVPYFSDLDASAVGAAALAGVVGLMSVPGRFGLGMLSDYVNRRYLAAAALAVMAVSFVLIARATTIAEALPALIVYSVAQGGVAVIPQALLADYFGRSAFATIQGLRGTIQMAGIVTGPILAGYVYDSTGSYDTAFIVFAVATAVSMVLVLMARPPQRPATGSRGPTL